MVDLKSHSASRLAFTLVELLIVIALIAFLLSLLVPALAGAKAKIRGISCLGNLKQWSVATHLYATDHDDYLPPEGSPNGRSLNHAWYVTLPEVLGLASYHLMPWRTNAQSPTGHSIWICPANTNRSNGINLFHYCLNDHVDGTGSNDRPVKLASVRNPVSVVWLFDNGGRAAVAQQNNVHTNVHRRGAHLSFLDGHVARFRDTEYWDFAQDRGRTNNPALVWRP